MQIVFIFSYTGLFAQGTPTTTTYFEFTYDASGNRTQRRVIEIPNDPNDPNAKTTDTTRQNNSNSDSSSIFTDKIGKIKLSLYPNPTRDFLTFKIKSDTIIFNSEMNIYNESGVFVFSKANLLLTEIIDFSIYSAGIYYLKFTINNKVKSFKVIKEN